MASVLDLLIDDDALFLLNLGVHARESIESDFSEDPVIDPIRFVTIWDAPILRDCNKGEG